MMLLMASLVFYMCWKWEYIFLLFFPATIDFFVAKAIEREEYVRKRKLLLCISLITNLGLLFYFKYFNFFAHSFVAATSLFNFTFSVPDAKILLPVGISFYTFQSISYTVEVYRKKQKAIRSFGKFALFVSYFPQLVAGPINRPQLLLPQLSDPKPLEPGNLVKGFRLILWGLFKKVAIADRLAYYVNIVFDNPGGYSGLPVLIAIIFFAFQIYCDFSGYSDIAIGVAKTMGIDLALNFNKPYFATSIKDFWSRWHISLSTWFRDYLYIPLGGNRTSMPRWLFNLFITFLVSGLWHGSNWTFIIWGAIHGLVITLEALNSKKRFINVSLPSWMCTLFTFTIVCFAWIFFRANNLHDAVVIINNLFKTSSSFSTQIAQLNGSNLYNMAVGLPLIILLLLFEKGWEWNWVQTSFHSRKLFRYACYISLVILISMFGVMIEQSSFIYFQF